MRNMNRYLVLAFALLTLVVGCRSAGELGSETGNTG